MAVALVALLPGAVDEDESRPLGRVGEGAALGEDGDGLLRVAQVVDHQPHEVTRIVAADIVRPSAGPTAC